MAADSSSFYSGNLTALLGLLVKQAPKETGGQLSLDLNLEDDIIAAVLVTHQGQSRLKRFD